MFLAYHECCWTHRLEERQSLGQTSLKPPNPENAHGPATIRLGPLLRLALLTQPNLLPVPSRLALQSQLGAPMAQILSCSLHSPSVPSTQLRAPSILLSFALSPYSLPSFSLAFLQNHSGKAHTKFYHLLKVVEIQLGSFSW